MKIAIVKNTYKKSIATATKIKKELQKNYSIVQSKPDVVIAVGGDGTFLNAFKKYWTKNPKAIFVSVHSGTLGFYSDFVCDEVDKFLKLLIKGKYKIQNTSALEIINKNKKVFALNDFRLETHTKTAIVDVFINGKFLEKFRGNGLCFSTITGSTAYNKSLGGAVMWETAQGFQMTEIAGIANNAYSSLKSSLIFGPKDKVVLEGVFENTLFGFDAQYQHIKGKQKILVKLASKKVKIARFTTHYNFYQRLRDGFIK